MNPSPANIRLSAKRRPPPSAAFAARAARCARATIRSRRARSRRARSRRARSRLGLHRDHIDLDFEIASAVVDDEAVDRRNVGVVAPARQDDMVVALGNGVGRVDAEPAERGAAPDRRPRRARRRRRRAAAWPGGGIGADVAADVKRRQAEAAQARRSSHGRKSWQTPRRAANASAGVVDTSVARGVVGEIGLLMRLLRCERRPHRSAAPGVKLSRA